MMISAVLNVIISAIILRYVIELEQENCECSLDWQHRFIKYFAPVVILVSLIVLVTSKEAVIRAVRNNKALGGLYLMYLLVALFYSVVIVLYFLKLRYSKCKCARNWKQYGLLYPLIGLASLLLLVMIFTIISVFGLLPALIKKMSLKKNKNKSVNKTLLENISNINNNSPKVRGKGKK